MIGQKERAIQAFDDRIRALDPSESFSFAYLTAGLTFVHLLSGDLHQAKVQAQQIQTVNWTSSLSAKRRRESDGVSG